MTRSSVARHLAPRNVAIGTHIARQSENAFAEEEVSTVEMLVREAGSILERATLLEMREAVLASVNDAVIVPLPVAEGPENGFSFGVTVTAADGGLVPALLLAVTVQV